MKIMRLSIEIKPIEETRFLINFLTKIKILEKQLKNTSTDQNDVILVFTSDILEMKNLK